MGIKTKILIPLLHIVALRQRLFYPFTKDIFNENTINRVKLNQNLPNIVEMFFISWRSLRKKSLFQSFVELKKTWLPHVSAGEEKTLKRGLHKSHLIKYKHSIGFSYFFPD